MKFLLCLCLVTIGSCNSIEKRAAEADSWWDNLRRIPLLQKPEVESKCPVGDGEILKYNITRMKWMINSIRSAHIDTPELEWDEKLSKDAQQQACDLARAKGTLLVCTTDQTVADLIYYSKTPLGGALTVMDVIKNWYLESLQHYNWRIPRYQSAASQFSVLVWKSTTHFGCDWVRFPQLGSEIKAEMMEKMGDKIADAAGGDVMEKLGRGLLGKLPTRHDVIMVCRFSPPGNVDTAEAFRANVNPLKPWDELIPDNN